MLDKWIIHFACVNCNGDLYISKIQDIYDDRIRNGTITCKSCFNNYTVSNYIPRFVSNENYTKGFGFQWNKHIKTQFESYNGYNGILGRGKVPLRNFKEIWFARY